MSDVEGVPDERDEGTEQPVDFADDLDQLAVVEIELADAESELEALDDSGADPDPEPAS